MIRFREAIDPSVKKYFESIFKPLTFKSDLDLKLEKNPNYKLTSADIYQMEREGRSPFQKIVALIRALRGVGRETILGSLMEEINSGAVKDYTMEDLEVAYKIFKYIYTDHLQHGYVDKETFLFSRDPKSVTEDITGQKKHYDEFEE